MTDTDKTALLNESAEYTDEPDAADDGEEKALKIPGLNAIQARLGSISPSFISSLPEPVKRRIKALKNIQLNSVKIESKFYEEVHELECKYAALYQPLYEQRKKITTGEYEPNDAECEWPSEDEDEDAEGEDASKVEGGDTKGKEGDVNKLSQGVNDKCKISADAKGIPEFWLTIFKNVDLLSEMVQEHDEPVLRHLQDVTVTFHKGNNATGEQMGFTVNFHFAPNEYFTNSVLTKHYTMKCEPDEADPFSFEGPEIIKCQGCSIDWNKGKNVTVKTVKKKQKHKSHGAVRTITKQVQNDSFFNFFSPPQVPDNDDAEVDEETQATLAADFEIGHFIRERVVPRGVLYFTGEALDDDDDYEDGDESESDSEDEDEDDESDADVPPRHNPRSKHPKSSANNVAKPEDCKQQ